MVSRVVLLDAGPLGLVTNPNRSPRAIACAGWLQGLVAASHRVIVPEIADYEVRRELLRANKPRGIGQLDALRGSWSIVPITTAADAPSGLFLGSGPAAGTAHGRRQDVGRGHDSRRSSHDLGRLGRGHRDDQRRPPIAFCAG